MRKTIDLVYFNAGGGHRAAAQALQSVIAQQQRPWTVRLVNLVEVLDPAGSFCRLMGFAPEDLYNKRLARGWTLGLAQELKLLQAMIRIAHPALLRRLQQHWLRSEPDLVVSLIPNFNRALHESVSSSLPGVPFVTVMTDMADLPPHFWIEPGQRQHLICGTPHAVAQARAAGYAPQQISQVSGMILRPDFYRVHDIDRAQEQRALGLDPAQPTGVVMFGGEGSRQMLGIAQRLRDVQLILLCGRNAALAERLRALPAVAPRVVLGFTPAVGRYMQLGDFFIGKPGPGSLSEAVQMGLPPITFDNVWTMPQERYNTQWLREQGLGLVLSSPRQLRQGVAELMQRLPELRARVQSVDNRAVFEVPQILARLLEQADGTVPQAGAAAVELAQP
jgi:hypothetical protein